MLIIFTDFSGFTDFPDSNVLLVKSTWFYSLYFAMQVIFSDFTDFPDSIHFSTADLLPTFGEKAINFLNFARCLNAQFKHTELRRIYRKKQWPKKQETEPHTHQKTE